MLCFQLKEAAMARTDTITMTMHVLDRLKVIQALVDGELKPRLAAA